ncbi:MAG: ABC transporter ATP-binding protein [Eubacteriales bacterium]
MKLNVKELDVTLNNNHILKKVDIHIKNKEFIGIIGPNGSGKSTFLKCVYRVLKKYNGGIRLDGKDLSEYSIKKTAKMMSVVSQHNNDQFDFSVLDIVMLGRSPHKKFLERDNKTDYDIVYESLDQVGMKNFAERSYSSLSGGEKQRIILARALAQKTKCLILDEPTNHLDIKHKLQIMGIVKKLDITVISAIHDLNTAALYCDKIYALKSGKVIADGTPEEVLTEKVIRDLYGVNCKVVQDEDLGALNIIYKPL